MIKYYEDRVCLNVLTQSIDNAKECYDAAEGHILLGILSANYNTVEEAVSDMKKYQEAVNGTISLGLGAGNPKYARFVSEISKDLRPQHTNQIFSEVGITRGLQGDDKLFINSLVSPSGKVGYVKISTGHLSSLEEPAIIPNKTALTIIKEMGGNSVKFFPMRGLETKDEYIQLCKDAAELDFIVEPTGGIDLKNFREIVEIPLQLGVPKVIPHVYSSIIDQGTKLTKKEDVEALYNIIKEICDSL